MNDARCTRAVLTHVAETAAQDARQLQPDVVGEAADLLLRLVDQIAARFGVLLFGEPVANRPDASADAVARVDDGDRCAARGEIARGGEACESGARDEHRHAVQRRSRHVLTLNGNRGRLR